VSRGNSGYWCLTLIAGAWLPATGCSTAAGKPAGGADSIYVGVATTSDSVGTGYINGVRLALETLNRTRPAGMRPLAVQPPHGTGDVMIAAGFQGDARIVAVIGHTGSAATLAAAPIYADAEHGGQHAVLAITPTATNTWVTRTTRWVFRVCPTDDASARALARFAVDSMHAKRVAILYRDDLFGRGFSGAFADELVSRHGAVVERDPYLHGITEFDAYAVRMTRRNADALVIAGSGTDAEEIVSAVRRAGSRAALLGSDDLSSLAGPATARQFAGLRYTAFYDPRSTRPATRAFDAAFRQRFGEAPGQRAALAYDAATLIGHAVFVVGPDRTRVRDWVAQAPPLEGVTGTIRFATGSGDAVDKQVAIGQVGP
jgi:branched-chain amino acid transport system substrate-binding protein